MLFAATATVTVTATPSATPGAASSATPAPFMSHPISTATTVTMIKVPTTTAFSTATARQMSPTRTIGSIPSIILVTAENITSTPCSTPTTI